MFIIIKVCLSVCLSDSVHLLNHVLGWANNQGINKVASSPGLSAWWCFLCVCVCVCVLKKSRAGDEAIDKACSETPPYGHP